MKATLITGASGGIGEEFARRLASQGHNLVLVARSEKLLHELCDELMLKHKNTAHYIVADLLDTDSPQRIFEETEKHGFEVNMLINNAGFGSGGDFAELPLEKELLMIDLNIRALVALTHFYIQGMRQRKNGTIVNVSSAAGFQPVPYMATYAATKAFVSSFSEAIAEESADFNIQVLALCPGSTKTKFFETANIERRWNAKGQETVEQVVDTAMKVIGTSRRKVVSGWTNWTVATASNIAPNFLITKFVARAMKQIGQKEV